MSLVWRVVALLAACGGWCQLAPGAAAVLGWEAAANGQAHVSRDAIGAALRDRLRGAPESVGSLQDILTQAHQTRYQQQQQQQQQRSRAEAWTQAPAARDPVEPRRQRPEIVPVTGADRTSASAAAADTVERPYQYQQQQQYQRSQPNSIQDVLRQVAPLEAAGGGGGSGGADYGYPAMGPHAASPALAQLPPLFFGRQLNAGQFTTPQLPPGPPLMQALDALATMQLLRLGAQGGGLGPAVLGSSLVPAATAPPQDPLLALLMAMAQQPFPPIG